MSLRMERALRRKKRVRFIKTCILALAIILTGVIGYQIERRVAQHLKEQRMQLFTVQQGTIIDELSGRALIINKEFLVLAPRSGSFENLVKENDKVRKGQPLGYLVEGEYKTTVTSPATGIFSMRIDGLEQVLKNQALAALSLKEFSYQPRLVNASSRIKADQVLCKVIDNLRPNTLIVKIEGDGIISTIKPGDRLSVSVQGQKLGSAQLKEARSDGLKLLKIDMDNFCEPLLSERYASVVMSFDIPPASIIPVTALLGNGNENRLYVYRDGRLEEKKVMVKKIKDDLALVSGVEANEMVVSTPNALKPGDI